MDQTPRSSFVHKLGYTHRVYVGGNPPKRSSMHEWLNTQLGVRSQGAWSDQNDYMCFKHEADAILFEMVWCT